MIVEELGSVITVKAQDWKWEGIFDFAQLLQYASFATAPDGALFAPSGGDVHAVNGVGELSGRGLSAMGHTIGFKKAGACLIPLVDPHWDLISDEGTWLCSGASTPGVAYSHGLKQTIDGGGGDLQQSLGYRSGQGSKEALVPRDPQGQDSFETFGAGKISSQPNPFQHSENALVVIEGFRAPFSWLRLGEASIAPQHADGVLAVEV